MNSTDRLHYSHMQSGGTALHREPRGLIAVRGSEAVQFLDGLITNDVKTLEDGAQMTTAFPDAKGRLLAVVRVARQGDRFLIETEDVTRQKVYENLFRFTMAGDFFVDDLSQEYTFIRVFDRKFIPITPPFIEFDMKHGTDYFVHAEDAYDFVGELKYLDAPEISDELFEVLRIEHGLPSYGIDMDDTTIVPEIGESLISYQKGCYIGQEIIARIHFRGHVAKRLTGVAWPAEPNDQVDEFKGVELTSTDGKSAGRITSVTISPALEKAIALAYVRYDYLAEGTALKAGEQDVKVTDLPFIK